MKTKKYYLHAAKIFTEKKIKDDFFVLIDNGIISNITQTPSSDIPVINLGKLNLLPGFLDLHIHGREGADIMDATPEAVETISKSLAKHGVIGFLGTTVTSTWENTLAAFSNIGDAFHNQPSGAQVLGAYNEGLFFTEDHKGAHDEKYFLPLDKTNINSIIEASKGALKIVALAPELENSEEIISYLSSQGIIPMLGHTNANYKQTCDALHAGACGGVHVFNGMKGIHHRDPGCAGAVLLDKDAYVETNGMPTRYNLKGTMSSNIKVDKISGWIIEAKINQAFQGDVYIKDNPRLPGGLKIPMIMESNMTFTNK